MVTRIRLSLLHSSIAPFVLFLSVTAFQGFPSPTFVPQNSPRFFSPVAIVIYRNGMERGSRLDRQPMSNLLAENFGKRWILELSNVWFRLNVWRIEKLFVQHEFICNTVCINTTVFIFICIYTYKCKCNMYLYLYVIYVFSIAFVQ